MADIFRASGRRTTLALIAAAAALPALVPALLGAIPAHRDLLVFFLPMKIYLGQRLAAGDLPLWDPFTENGAPFMANLQSQVFYLPNLLTAILPPAWGYGLFAAFHLAAAALGLYFWARLYRVSRGAAAAGALAFGLGGTMVAAIEFSSILAVAPWIPWSCWAAVQLVRRPTPRYLAGYLAAVAALGLAGEPHTALAGAVMAFVFGLQAACSDRKQTTAGSCRRGVLSLVGGGLLAAGLISFQLLPFVELVGRSERQGGLPLELAAMHSVQRGDVLGLLAPDPDAYDPAGGGGRGQDYLRLQYQGVVALLAVMTVLGTLTLRGRTTDATRPIALLALATIAVHWLLAAGDHLPVFPLLHRAGLLASLRYPAKFILPASAAIAVLVALGVDRLAAGGRRLVAAGGVVTLGTAAIGLALGDSGFLHSAAFAAAVTAIIASRPGRPLLLATVLGVDLLLAHALVHPMLPAADLLADFDAARKVRAEDGRVYPRPYTQVDMRHEATLLAQGDLFSASRLRVLRLMGNLPMALGVRSARGGPALRLRSQARFLQSADQGPAGVPTLQRGASSYLLSIQPLQAPALTPASETADLPHLYRLDGALPRHYLACSWRSDDSPASRISAPDVVRGHTTIVSPEAATLLPPSVGIDPASLAPVQVERDEPDSRRFAVNSPTDCLLVIVETYYPGWTASVDGQATPVIRANDNWMAVPIPAGTSVVELDFRPPSLRSGSVLSALCLLLAVVWAWSLRGHRD